MRERRARPKRVERVERFYGIIAIIGYFSIFFFIFLSFFSVFLFKMGPVGVNIYEMSIFKMKYIRFFIKKHNFNRFEVDLKSILFIFKKNRIYLISKSVFYQKMCFL